MNPTCKLLATLLLAASGICYSQTFHSDEEFYRFIENRQKMAIDEFWARKAAAVMAEEKRVADREAAKQRVNQAIRDEIDRRGIEAVNYFRAQRGEPPLPLPVPASECNQ